MIQAANVGVGIVGKEGRQASLAADFSITQFSHVTSLFLVRLFVMSLAVLLLTIQYDVIWGKTVFLAQTCASFVC